MITITNNQIKDFISCAFEGGINYWCDGITVKNNDFKGENCSSGAISNGAALILEIYEGDGVISKKELKKDDIYNALEQIESKIFNRLVNDNYDADDVDKLIQIALFNKVIFG